MYNHTLRTVLDVSSSNWNDWKIAKDENGMHIVDVMLDPNEIRTAVRKANNASSDSDIDGRTHADPVSMGVADVIEVNGVRYCFVKFWWQR